MHKKIEKIKLLVLDCDGTLTDGKMIYNSDKTQSKNFNAADGLGIMLLRFTDIIPAVITGSQSKAIEKRFADLKVEHLHQKVHNKTKFAQALLDKLNLDWENLAYMGDDWNDFPVMKRAGFSAAVANAPLELQKKVDFVTNLKGGEGAVRELIELILKKQGIYEKTLEDFLHFSENH